MMVLLFHYTFRGYAADGMSVMPYPALAPVFKYGYLGVELFFLISGFVILMTASSGSLQKFFVSRVVRLYPAYWFCCTVTFLTMVVFGGERYSATISQYLINMTMMNEFIGVQSLDGVYWSLAIELQFYAVIGLLLLLGQIRRAQSFLVAWLIATIAVKVFPVGWAINTLLIVDYAPYFIAGATCFLVYSHGVTLTRVAMILAAWVIALINSLQAIPRLEAKLHTNFDHYAIVGLVSIFFMAVVFVSIKRTNFLSKREWLTVGAVTYPLYLIHQNVGFIVFNIAYPSVNPHLLLWGTTSAMLFFSYLVNRWVEQKYAPRLKRGLNNAIEAIWKKRAI